MELPVGDGGDHPEGMALLPDGGAAMELLVVYDSPHDDRKVEGNGAVHADVFRLKADSRRRSAFLVREVGLICHNFRYPFLLYV